MNLKHRLNKIRLFVSNKSVCDWKTSRAITNRQRYPTKWSSWDCSSCVQVPSNAWTQRLVHGLLLWSLQHACTGVVDDWRRTFVDEHMMVVFLEALLQICVKPHAGRSAVVQALVQSSHFGLGASLVLQQARKQLSASTAQHAATFHTQKFTLHPIYTFIFTIREGPVYWY